MNRAQRSIVLAAVAMASLMMALAPPWESPRGHYRGHAAITSPPGGGVPEPEPNRWALPRPELIARISIPLLVVQFAVLCVSAGTALLLLGRSRGGSVRCRT